MNREIAYKLTRAQLSVEIAHDQTLAALAMLTDVMNALPEDPKYLGDSVVHLASPGQIGHSTKAVTDALGTLKIAAVNLGKVVSREVK